MINFSKIFDFLTNNPKLTIAGVATMGTAMAILLKVKIDHKICCFCFG